LHTPPGHVVPAGAWPVCWQTGDPVVHEIVPVRHGLLFGLHAAPVAHAVHCPPLHTMFVPHGVPSDTLPVALHTDAPVEHDVDPVLHALLGGVHETPAVHETH
jgi:hypothetical protein